MTTPVYVYMHANKPFEFVKLGDYIRNDGDIQCYLTVIYNIDRFLIMNIATEIAERSTISKHIDNHELIDLLSTAFLSNMGYFSIKHNELKYYLKDNETCKDILQKYMCDAVFKNFNLIEAKELVMYNNNNLQWLDNALDEMFEKEANTRYLNVNAKKIQRAWRQVISNPYHSYGRKALLREFDKLINERV